MRILVLNGSPKGENSITLQTIRYLEKRFPEETFEVLHVGQRIKALEKIFRRRRRRLLMPTFFCSAIRSIRSSCRASCTGSSSF